MTEVSGKTLKSMGDIIYIVLRLKILEIIQNIGLSKI